MGFRWIFVYPWKDNVRSVKQQYIRSLKGWYESNYMASWSEFAKYIGKIQHKAICIFFYKSWSFFYKKTVWINPYCPWFKFFKWCLKQYIEIQDVTAFRRFIWKTKVLNNSCNQFVCNFYPQSILLLEECLQKWWNTNLI